MGAPAATLRPHGVRCAEDTDTANAGTRWRTRNLPLTHPSSPARVTLLALHLSIALTRLAARTLRASSRRHARVATTHRL